MGSPASHRIARVRCYSSANPAAASMSPTRLSRSLATLSRRLRIHICSTSVLQQQHIIGLPTPSVQRLLAWHTVGLGCSRFARHYYGNAFCSSGYMRCFSSPGALRRSATVIVFRRSGCPIRRSWDQRLLAAPPRLSQLCHVLHRHAAPRHPPSAPSVFPTGRLETQVDTLDRFCWRWQNTSSASHSLCTS